MPEKMTVDPVAETPNENESKRTALSQPGSAPPAPAKASIFASSKARLVLVLLVLLVIAGTIYYVTEVAGYETTDDAQVDGHLMSLSARVGGYVQKVNVDDNQAVTQGATLV
jgi:membrane fusion protein, multidrug efflux system